MLQTSVAVGAERETLARVRSRTGPCESTEGDKPAATGGREKREKPGQPSLASWDHDLVAIAHEAWQSGAVLVDMNPLGACRPDSITMRERECCRVVESRDCVFIQAHLFTHVSP